MKRAWLVLALLGLGGCEHDEHPFEVWWTSSCSAEGMPPILVVFDKDFWEDDRGNRREYTGEVQLQLADGLWDSWLWTVEVNLRDETAETVDLVHLPIPDDFVDAYDLRPLDLQALTYTEDPEGTWARMSGTCAWGQTQGELNLSMADDCDACIECSTIGFGVPGMVVLFPVILGIRRRRERLRSPTPR